MTMHKTLRIDRHSLLKLTILEKYFILFLLILSFTSEVILADQSYTANSSRNKTFAVDWTLNDEGTNHVIRCVGDENVKLRWLIGLERLDNFTIDEALIDVSKINEISITFNRIDHQIMNDYFCEASNPTDATANKNFTYFRVSVSEPKSKGVVAGAGILLILFIGTVFMVCKSFKLNDIATRIQT